MELVRFPSKAASSNRVYLLQHGNNWNISYLVFVLSFEISFLFYTVAFDICFTNDGCVFMRCSGVVCIDSPNTCWPPTCKRAASELLINGWMVFVFRSSVNLNSLVVCCCGLYILTSASSTRQADALHSQTGFMKTKLFFSEELHCDNFTNCPLTARASSVYCTWTYYGNDNTTLLM